MNKRLFFIFSTVIIAGFSCKKGDDPEPPVVIMSYLNASAGNTWNYEETDNAATPVSVSTYSLVSSSQDTSIGTKSYHKFTRSNGGTSEYRNVTGTDYFEFLTLPAAFGGSKVENLYLNSTSAVGTVWSQPLPTINNSGLTANVTKTDTIRAVGLTMSVKGKTYTDVIQVSTGFTVTSSNLPITLTSDIQNYYAPKVGKISGKNVLRIQISFAGIDQTINTKTELDTVNF